MKSNRCFKPESNPFATKFVSPGAIEWLADGGNAVAEIRQRFCERLSRRGAIVGPHGSGKSTLLEHLVPHLGSLRFRRDASGRIFSNGNSGSVVWLGLRRHAATQLHREHWQSGGLLVLDGFEQLRALSRLRVLLETRVKRIGLLVTSHRGTALPTLLATNATLALVRALVAARCAEVEDLPSATRELLLDTRYLEQLMLRTDGNVREVFMLLYDRYQVLEFGDSSPPLSDARSLSQSHPDKNICSSMKP